MKVKQTLTNNSPTILAGLGIVGFITSVVMSAKAAPKAAEALRTRYYEKPNEIISLKDKIKITAPIYAPTAGMVLISTACVVGSNSIHRYRYASLLALYSIGQQAMDRWQDAVLGEVGKKKYEKVRERVAEPEGEPPVSLVVDDERTLFYDKFTGRFFRASSIEIVRKAINDLNDRMFREDFVSLNEFYFEIGLPQVEFGDEAGWNVADGSIKVTYDAFIKNDKPCISVSFVLSPKTY